MKTTQALLLIAATLISLPSIAYEQKMAPTQAGTQMATPAQSTPQKMDSQQVNTQQQIAPSATQNSTAGTVKPTDANPAPTNSGDQVIQ